MLTNARLEPVEGYAGVYLVHVPFERIPHGLGATHHIDSDTIRHGMCMTKEEASRLFLEPCEYSTYLLVTGPAVSTAPRFIIVTSGVFRAVIFDPTDKEKVPFATNRESDLKPTRDLIVPAGLAVALQVLVGNRASFLVASHGNPTVRELPNDMPRCAPYWFNASERDRAVDVSTGKVITPPS